jgi:hypothetical protein
MGTRDSGLCQRCNEAETLFHIATPPGWERCCKGCLTPEEREDIEAAFSAVEASVAAEVDQ